MTEHIRIAMWAGPRNISTTILRSFENRPDTAVIDEPFYAHYLRESGAQHPMRDEILAAQPADWRGVVASFGNPPSGGENILFQKHIAYHYGPDLSLDWLSSHRVFLLIRDPRAMIASFRRNFDDVAPIADSLVVQRRIYDALTMRRQPCPIVDSRDVLTDPEGTLRTLCAQLDIPFTDKMLSWPTGGRQSDGVWAPHWYDAVAQSTGFRPYEEMKVDLSPVLEAIAEQCHPYYDFLHKRRLTPQ